MGNTTAVIYASKLGKTRKVGNYIAKSINADMFDLKKQTMINMSAYNRIIFGTGIHAGKPYKSLVTFLEVNKAELAKKKTSLFICCMYNDEKGQAQCERVSGELGIAEAVFFDGKSEKNEEGFEIAVDDFIAKLRA